MNYYELNKSPTDFIKEVYLKFYNNEKEIKVFSEFYMLKILEDWFLLSYKINDVIKEQDWKIFFMLLSSMNNGIHSEIKRDWLLKSDLNQRERKKALLDFTYERFLPKFKFFKNDNKSYVYIETSSVLLLNYLEDSLLDEMKQVDLPVTLKNETLTYKLDLKLKYRESVNSIDTMGISFRDVLDINDEEIQNIIEDEVLDSMLTVQEKSSRSEYKKGVSRIKDDLSLMNKLNEEREKEYKRVFELIKDRIVLNVVLESFD